LEFKGEIMSTVFYISTQGSDNWSGKFDVPNAENTDGPLCTIQEVQKRIRHLKELGEFVGQVDVHIRGGIYNITEPITFTPKDSGSVVYQAYSNETPIIDGGKRITGWHTEIINGKEVWATYIPEVERGDWYFRQLFVNNNRRVRTRLPKSGYYWMENVDGLDDFEPYGSNFTNGSDNFEFKKGDIKNFQNLTDVEIIVHHYWLDVRLPIAEVDEEKCKVKCSLRSVLCLIDDVKQCYAKYYIENTIEGLTDPGEWYLDRNKGKLYYIPMPTETIETVEIYAPVVSRLLAVEGDAQNNEYVENLIFKGIKFRHSDWYHTRPNSYKCPDYFNTAGFDYVTQDCGGSPQAAIHIPGSIYFKGARNCTMQSCTIEHIGFYGIELYKGCTNNSINSNLITDVGAGGIRANGGTLDNKLTQTGNNTFENNHIYNLGNVFQCGIGILTIHSFENRICNNTIHDLYYSGISCGWVWGFAESISCNNIIQKNHIYNLGKGIMSDMGGIYLLGKQPGTIVRNNVIHDLKCCNYGGWGIYLDEGSSYILVEDNIVYNADCQPFHQHYGRENMIRNNIFAFGGEGQFRVTKSYDVNRNGQFEKDVKNSLTIERNIFIGNKTPMQNYIPNTFHLNNSEFIIDLNLYWDISYTKEQGTEQFIGIIKGKDDVGNQRYEFISFGKWKQMGHDCHSIYENPEFKDILNYNFELEVNSPVFKIGFKNIDYSDVGVKKRIESI
jgi:hypothetical protein